MGLDPGRFWSLTPREISREFMAREKAVARATAENAWLAWHVAALTRAKKLPPLKKMIDGLTRPNRANRQSPEIQLAMMKSMFLAFGGDPQQLRE